MVKQYLPHYTRNFLEKTDWKQKKSKHYSFHFFSGSVAEKEIDFIIERQEKAYRKILNFLNLPEPTNVIEYYFYPDAETKQKLMGDDWYAQSIYEEFRIHTLYTKDIKPIGEHEDAHLLSLPWGLSVGFFQEGLAEYLVGHAWDNKPHSHYVKIGYEKKIYPDLNTFMKHKVWLNTNDVDAIYFYSLAGAFVSFLISKFGKEKFESFYRQSNRNNVLQKNEKLFESVYNNNLTSLEKDFKNQV
ncbi:MAG: hypothetical protein KAR00_03205 [Candidatus Pacebacteria bacterium]|nr:hypothetical protein [Candidatus Paceibacterota bacterium]